MTVFDPGLQPERTNLAWRRTALSIAVGSVVSLRVLPAILESALWLAPGVIGVVFAGWMWFVSSRRFADFTGPAEDGADEPRVPGARALLTLTLFVVAVGALALFVMLRSR